MQMKFEIILFDPKGQSESSKDLTKINPGFQGNRTFDIQAKVIIFQSTNEINTVLLA